uniref:Calcium-transporting ATPase n=1 Tax=Ditylenchus dipsaci TaxID=166011 RepID=A0A915DEQ0_9BILA
MNSNDNSQEPGNVGVVGYQDQKPSTNGYRSTWTAESQELNAGLDASRNTVQQPLSESGALLPQPLVKSSEATETNIMVVQGLNIFSASANSIEECATELRTDLHNGLSAIDATQRLQLTGYNEFQMTVKESLFRKYIEQFKNPLIALLLVSAIISVLLKQYDDALSITVAVVIVVSVGFVQEYRSEKTLEKLNKLVPPTCHCIRNGRSVQFFARELVPGDIVILAMGDRIPADLRIVEAIDLQIDESSFTGENEPRHKHINPVKTPESSGIEHLDNVAYMGTLICCGRGKGVVIGTGANSKFGEVFSLMQARNPKNTTPKQHGPFGTQLSLYSLFVIGGIFVIGLLQGRPILGHEGMFTIGVSLAVAAIPEGLPIVVAVTLAIGVMRMGNRNCVVKKLSAVETLGCVTVICSDKTGTLTKNEMTACLVIGVDGSKAEVSGVGYDPNEGQCVEVESGQRVSGNSHPSLSRVIQIGCVCNNAQIINGTVLGQPTEGALMVLALKTQMDTFTSYYRRLKEIPFNSETKWMAVQLEPVNRPGEVEVMLKGAPDKVIEMCMGCLDGGVQPSPLTPERRLQILQLSSSLGNSGLRVIAMACGKDMNSLYYAGCVGILDPPRPGCRESIDTVQSAGVSVKMITGDSQETACSIGARLHLYQPGMNCLSGAQMDEMSDLNLEKIIKVVTIFYRASPKHKLRIVKALQNIGEVVAMTGDGVNGRPFEYMLEKCHFIKCGRPQKADIGIAMGLSGTDVCKEAADMVLINDDFITIRAAIEEGKGIYHNITNFVKFQLSTSVAALSLIAFSTLFHFENPLNAMQILWINIIMDGPPAQSLGVETIDRDIIRAPLEM